MLAHPILKSIWRNKTGPVLICVQIAFTLALVVNAMFLIKVHEDLMQQPLGIDTDNIYTFNVGQADPREDIEAFIKNDLEAIRELPEVIDATPVLNYFHDGYAKSWTYRGAAEPSEKHNHVVNINNVDEHGLNALGVELIAGRNFLAREVVYLPADQMGWPDIVIVTESLAAAFFPDDDIQSIVGKNVYWGEDSADKSEIIGIVHDIATGWMASVSPMAKRSRNQVMLHPLVENYPSRGHNYLVRTQPGAQDRMIQQIEEVLFSIDADRLIYQPMTQLEVIATSYRSSRAITQILQVVAILILTITVLGIVGLASFSVSQRTRQIGTRRALGAKKTDIIRYFLAENVLLTTLGVVLGACMAVGIQIVLFNMLQTPKMPPEYLAVGIFAMYTLGGLAVLGPAMKAASIPPAIASKTV